MEYHPQSPSTHGLHMADRGLQVLNLEDRLLVQTQQTGITIYDFDFRAFLPCRSLWGTPPELPLVARIGAFDDYATWYDHQQQQGFMPIHMPDDHARCSQLSHWYPLIEEFTPRSRVYETQPTVEQIESEFDWPVFVKGVRQTSRHQRKLSIVSSAAEFTQVMRDYERDPILHWQPVVVREYVPLRLVEDAAPDRIPSSFEFRTFWWHGRRVGAGRYWWQGKPYDWTSSEQAEALRVGEIVAQRLKVAFLVIDLAMTAKGRWIVIECNDGQESGYAGVSPLAMWSAILQQV